jgi:hypothetical protein
MRTLLLVMTGGMALAQLPQTPQSVVDFLASAAGALSQAHSDDSTIPSDAGRFFDHFDSNMPGLATLKGYVEGLVVQSDVSSSIELVSDVGDDRKRTLELDWVLQVQDQPMRRRIVKVIIEKGKKDWKFTSLEPIDFFKPGS